MEISCTECGKQHNIPDTAIDNKKIFFYCNSCGHKIIVDNRKNFVKQQSSRKDIPVIGDILSGIPLAFNFNSILISSIYAILFIMTSLLCSITVFRSSSFVANHPRAVIIIFITIALVFYYLYILVLYFISKISYFKMLNPGYKRLDWKFINFDIAEDSLVLFIIYIFSMTVFTILILPVVYLSKGGIIYTGIMFTLFYGLFFVSLFSLSFMNFIPAIVASKSQFVIESISEIIEFFKKEFLNIPVYIIIVKILTSLVYGIVTLFLTIPLLMTSGILFILMHSKSKTALFEFFTRIYDRIIGKSPDQITTVSADVTLGTILIIIFLMVFCVLIWALFVTISQTLYTKAVFIMQKNPEHSINRTVYLVILIVLTVLIYISSSKIYALYELLSSEMFNDFISEFM